MERDILKNTKVLQKFIRFSSVFKFFFFFLVTFYKIVSSFTNFIRFILQFILKFEHIPIEKKVYFPVRFPNRTNSKIKCI